MAWTWIILSLVLLAYILVQWKSKTKKKKLPPGPRGSLSWEPSYVRRIPSSRSSSTSTKTRSYHAFALRNGTYHCCLIPQAAKLFLKHMTFENGLEFNV
ncbi:hypothetical protein CFP56_022548 [Quercus suber]|uniref:Uncharacterized protein n=1 Tax=Quercus suber TaxID=58331 RepID=A0AAW0KAL8_QUESU